MAKKVKQKPIAVPSKVPKMENAFPTKKKGSKKGCK